MKQREKDYDGIVNNEITKQVLDYTREAKDDPEETNILVTSTSELISQVLQTDAVQTTVIELTKRVLQSPKNISAVRTLCGAVLADLLKDPDMRNHLVRVVTDVSKDKRMERAAGCLIPRLRGEKDAFTTFLARLGEEKDVLRAMTSLLAESAHMPLNDSEFLDHSMDFAPAFVVIAIVRRSR
mmetsp:Transcript_57561/g.68714  ORF Transcript_57561/g.68714 Transcript_57561/m.68714 type:complete len:183 (-) Transcript_57561:303-851(-)